MLGIKIFIFSLIAFSLPLEAADLNLSPGSLKLAIYKVSASTSPLCTNLVTVVDNGDTPSEVNFMGGVSLGTGSISNGTYPCIVIEFADHIKFTPSTNSSTGNCSSSTEETLDVCQGGMSSTSVLADGTTTTCTNSSDRVAMYISTASTQTTGSDAFNPPTSLSDTTYGFNLASSLVVSGAVTGKFVVNPSGKVCDGSDAGCEGGSNPGTCQMAPPLFSFTLVE